MTSTFLDGHYLALLPFFNMVSRLFFIGKEAGSKEIALFKRGINAAPDNILKLRLKVIGQSYYDGFKSYVPAVYIAADRDRLVPAKKREEFKEAYREIIFIELDAPHFILQAKPKQGACAIKQAVSLLTGIGN